MSHPAFISPYLLQKVCVVFLILLPCSNCLLYCDTCRKRIANWSRKVDLVDKVVNHTGSISIEVTANCNPVNVWPCSSQLFSYFAMDETFLCMQVTNVRDYLIRNIHYKLPTATAQAQWLQGHAAHPNDAGSISVAVGAFHLQNY